MSTFQSLYFLYIYSKELELRGKRYDLIFSIAASVFFLTPIAQPSWIRVAFRDKSVEHPPVTDCKSLHRVININTVVLPWQVQS